MMVYTHSGSEAYTAGLYNRRMKEKALFLEPVEEEDEMERWHTISDVPSGYYRNHVQRLIAEGVLAGTSDGLNITEDMLRTILIAERYEEMRRRELEEQIEKLEEQIEKLITEYLKKAVGKL